MLTIVVGLSESYDEEKKKFITDTFSLHLEHSLVSLSKWESRYEKPFLDKTDKTTEEVRRYIEDMILDENVPEGVLDHLSQKNVDEIHKYIDAKMSATWFNEVETDSKSSQKITSELIYYWIVSYRIPWEVQTWHLNRLFTLVKVFNVQNAAQNKKKRMTSQDAAAQRRMLNEQRRQQMKTNG